MNARPRPTRDVRSSALAMAFRTFFQTEASGGIALLVATFIALVWANSPWSASYVSLWETHLPIGAGRFSLDLDLRHWVGDGAMTFFFFVVGLEIKRELVTGELNSRRSAALPIAAALGGMVVPAAFYAVLNLGGREIDGWGVPMATDIAFVVGLLALLSHRVPTGLKVFLLALAIVDDLGAILVIAVFYAGQIDVLWLLLASASVGSLAWLQRGGRWRGVAFVALGTIAWVATYESGIHPTIVGVVLASLVSVRSPDDSETDGARLESLLHPWVSFVIVPLFAVANAGVRLSGEAVGAAVGSSIARGIVFGLVVGKLVGVFGAAWLAVRLNLAQLPADLGWRQLLGGAALAGIGFTVSIFIANLAFEDPAVLEISKIGILAGSALAAAIGTAILWTSATGAPTEPSRAG